MKIGRLRIEREKALTATPGVLEAIQDRRTNFYVRLGGTNRNAQISAAFERGQSASYGWLYTNRPAVRTVIDYIARNVSQLPLKLYERHDADNRERRDDHPAAELMRYPDTTTPTNQFVCRYVSDFLVYDNAYLMKFRPPGENGRLVLQRVPPYLVTVSGGRFTPDSYRIWRYDGSHLDVPSDDMIHWKGYNPDDALLGVSRLETLRDTLTEDATSQSTTVELMKNGLKGGHIERPLEAPEWSDEARTRFGEDWANQRSRAPRLDPVLEEGMKWVPTSISPKDAELLAGRRFTIEEVSRLYGIHPRVLGVSESGSSTELEDLRKQVYTDTLPPITQPLAALLDYCILREEYLEDDMYFEFDMNEKLRGDPDKRFAAITAAVGRPWMLVDEARALENRAAVEGGDELTIPLNVALGSLPAPNVMPPQDPNGPPQDGSHREGALPVGELEVKQPEQLPERASVEPEVVAPPRYAERALRALLERYCTRQADSLRTRSREFNADRWNRELSNDLYVLLREIVGRESGEAYDQMAEDDPNVKAVAVGAAESINAFVQGALSEHVEGEAFDRVKGRYQEVAGKLALAAVTLAQEKVSLSSIYSLPHMTSMPESEAPAPAPRDHGHPALNDAELLERLRMLREALGLPDEILWELAGFTEEEIDRMRALAHTRQLLAATRDADLPAIP